MLNVNNITIRNFLSVGNVTQSISFSNSGLYLILGENLDLGGADNRNGVGKTAILNALSYAFYGKPLVNIKLSNLINKTNDKNMLVTVDFEKNGQYYRIERGRKPNKFSFFRVDSGEEENTVDDTMGESRHTQDLIDDTIVWPYILFKHLVALNTYTEPFLSMSIGQQREIMEQLLGVTQLSEKAELLKEKIRTTKEDIKLETVRIETTKKANKRIELAIKELQKKSETWEETHNSKLKILTDSLNQLSNVDIQQELANHVILKNISDMTSAKATLDKEITQDEKRVKTLTGKLSQLDSHLANTTKKTCHTCGHALDSDKHEEIMKSLTAELKETLDEYDELCKELHVKKEQSSKIIIPELPSVFYATEQDAYEHKSKVESTEAQLLTEADAVNPHIEHMEELKQSGLETIDYTELNDLETLYKHQEFLLKILTNKDSFVRKKIINHNLAFLNTKLSDYLTDIGLPHNVTFLPDLTVEIQDAGGRDLDFDNLSRGERTRLILSLSWAFRDVYESLNDKMNIMMIDELMDNGLDVNGVNSALRIIKKMTRSTGRCIHLISHRDELMGRVDNVIKVIKENGFTSIDTSATA